MTGITPEKRSTRGTKNIPHLPAKVNHWEPTFRAFARLYFRPFYLQEAKTTPSWLPLHKGEPDPAARSNQHRIYIMVSMPDSAIVFDSVTCAINGRKLVDRLDLHVEYGETLVLLGQSGSGKTSTLKLVNRLLEPTSGKVLVEGKPTTEWDPIALRRRIGYVIQDVGLFPHFTVFDNAGLVPRLEHWDAARRETRVNEVLRLVGLDPQTYARRFPSELSGGQRQRVGVARSIAADPPILLKDEPFGALDPQIRADLQREFRDLQRKLRKTILFVTHDVTEALFLGDRIALLAEGRLVFSGKPGEFVKSDHPAVRAFLQPVREVYSSIQLA